MEIKIKRVTELGKPNRNGKIYEEKAYRKAMEEYNERIIKYPQLASVELFPNYNMFNSIETFQINLCNVCGRLTELTDDYGIIRIFDNEQGRKLKDHLFDDNIRLGMRAIGDCDEQNPINFIIDRIITFDILSK